MTTDYDVAIIGGGMVGATLAAALRTAPVRVAVIDQERPPRVEASQPYDLRVSALSPAAQRILEALAVWPGVTAQRVSPYVRMQVWDHGGPGAITFDAAELGQPVLGHVVENRAVQAALWDVLDAADSIDTLIGRRLSDIEWGGDAARVALDDGTRLTTRLVVGADGADSPVRASAGIETTGHGYEQEAVVATVETEAPHESTAWQRFLDTGPLAFLPLADGLCSIVWSTTPDHARRLRESEDEAFRAELAEAFEHRLGGIRRSGPRAGFPLRLMRARAYAGERVALVGDAAHVVHPLAGQGANLGLLDAAALAEVVGAAAARRRDPGRLAELRRYERWRKGHNLAMSAGLDAFNRLFGASWGPVPQVRGLGLQVVDNLPFMKHFFMRQAMGLEGDLPALARGR